MKPISNLRGLQAFRYAGELLSFKEAAEVLHVTQAAVSQQIRTLESQLGVSLFRRLTREVELTQEGRQLLPLVSAGFRQLEEGVSRLAEDPEPDRLTVTTLPSFAGRWLVPRLGRFQALYPDLNVSLSPTVALSGFGLQGADVAVRFGRGEYPGLKSVKLFDEYLLPVCHPDMIRPDRDRNQQVAEMPVLADDAPDVENVQEQFELGTGIRLNQRSVRLNTSDSNMLVEAVLSGQGLALIRYSLTSELLASGQLVCAIPVCIKSLFDYYLVAPPAHYQRPKVKGFGHWLQQEFAATTSSWQSYRDQNRLRCLDSSVSE